VGFKFNPLTSQLDLTGSGGAGAFAALTDLTDCDVTGVVDLRSDTAFEVGYDDGAGSIVLLSTGIDGFNNNHGLPDGSYVEMRGDASDTEKILALNVQDAGGTNIADLSVIVDANGVARIQSRGVSDYPCETYNGAGTTELVYAKTVHLFTGTAPSGNVIINKAKSGDVLYIKNDTASSITFIQNSTETFNGATTFVLTTGKVATFIQSGANGIYGVVSNKDLTGGVTTVGTVATVVTNANLTGDVTSVGNATTLGSNFKIDNKGLNIDGGGSAITTGIKGDLYFPFACTINSVTMLADQTGSIVVDIWKDTYANYPPTVADTIVAAAKPTITTATKSTDATLTGWTTSIAAGDTLRFNVDSVTSITRLHLSLKVTKT